MEFLIVNGDILRKEDANLTPFFWGEPLLLSQKMWYGFGGIPLFYENLELILLQFSVLGVRVPPLLKTKRELFRITKRMLNKNKFYRSGWIHFQFYCAKSTTNFVVDCNACEEFEFPISSQGSLVHFSEIRKNSLTPFNQFNFANRVLWQSEVAENYVQLFQNSLILNENGTVCEAIASNVFMVKNKQLLTPALATGCYEDPLRKYILEIAAELKFTVLESESISSDDFVKMNEVFLASEGNGIEWILGIDNKRFVKQLAIAVHLKLNERLKSKVH